MQQALRPYATTGITLAGAGLIAIAPIAPSLEVQAAATRAVHAAVELTGGATWIDLFNNTATDLGGLAQQILANPAPIASQVITNQLTNLQNIGAGLEKGIQGIINFLDPSNTTNSIWVLLQEFFSQLTAGSPVDAFSTLAGGILVSLIPLLPAITPINTAVASTFANLSSLVTTFTQKALLLTIALVSPPLAGMEGFGYGLQNILDAGSVLGAGKAVFDLPAATLNAFLNGYNVNFGGNLGLGGLIGSVNVFDGSQNPGGAIGSAHNLLLSMAESIGYTANPVNSAVQSAQAMVGALPNLDPASVTEGLTSMVGSLGLGGMTADLAALFGPMLSDLGTIPATLAADLASSF